MEISKTICNEVQYSLLRSFYRYQQFRQTQAPEILFQTEEKIARKYKQALTTADLAEILFCFPTWYAAVAETTGSSNQDLKLLGKEFQKFCQKLSLEESILP